MIKNNEKLRKEIEACFVYSEQGVYFGDTMFLRTPSIENLMSLFKSKETNNLKEFEEWLDKKYGFATDYDQDIKEFLEEQNGTDSNN